MTFKQTLSMQLVSFITMVMLVVAMPAPAFLAYAEEEAPPAPQEQVQEPTPEPTPEPGPQPEPEPQPEPQPQATEETQEDSSASSEAPSNPGDGENGVSNDGTDGEPDATPEEPEAGIGEDGAPGEDGEDGTGDSGEDVTPPSPDGVPAVIETGDASAGTVAAIEGNNTEIDTSSPPSSGGGGTEAETTYQENGGSESVDGEGEVAGAETSEEEQSTKAGQEHGDGSGAGGAGDTNVNLDNALAATSTGTSQAESGENRATDPDGAIIDTGRSDSFAYLISLFNVAVTNSAGAILFLKNPLGDALDFTQRIMDIFAADLDGASIACSFLGCSLSDAAFRMFANNEVDITNVAISRSNSGSNHATSTEGFAGIRTGDASAFSGIVNFGNLTIVDSRYLIILMTNIGALSGDIVLPEGDFFKQLSAGAKIGAGSSLDINNTAEIENQGDAGALTGSNTASGPDAGVKTGEANSNATTMNFVNQIGAPICFIVNVGGEWKGDVRRMPEGFTRESAPFGEIICGAGGASGEGRGPANFHATTTNYAKILNVAIAEAMTGDNTASGLASRIETGDADAFVQILNLVNQTIIGQDWIFALFTITGDWDGNLAFGPEPGQPDVLEQIADQIKNQIISGGSVGYYEPNIKLTKTASVNSATVPATIDYDIVIDNQGGKAEKITVQDTLRGPDDHVIGRQMWNLGSLDAQEKVTISYSVEYTGNLKPGYYTNTVRLTGMKNQAIGFTPMETEEVVEILQPGEVLGATGEDLSCDPLLTKYIKPGRVNDTKQVTKLQSFLNSFEGENLAMTGAYDSATQAAVKRFQSKYASDILAPWGISKPTGIVYYTTQKKVNSIFCHDEEKFTLTTEQQMEIQSFKQGIPSAPFTIDELIKLQDVGQKKATPNLSDIAPIRQAGPEIPVVHIPVSDAGHGVDGEWKPISLMDFAPFKFLSSWILAGLPTVEALEL